jgi:hypothetical protein
VEEMVRKSSSRDDLEFRAMCFHEAGHALACYLYRIPFGAVTVGLDGRYIGKVSISIRDAFKRLERWDKRGARSLAERIIRACVSGQIAEKKYSTKSSWKNHSRYDWEIVERVADKFSGSLKEAVAWSHYLYLNTEDELLCKSNWNTIKTLAKELRKHKMIGKTKARRLIKQTLLRFEVQQASFVELARDNLD